DYKVTGVQTCALPISCVQVLVAKELPSRAMELVGAGFCGYIHDPGMETVFGREKVSLCLEFLNLVHRNLKGKVAGPVVACLDARSEERRVGKEWVDE